MDKWGCSADRQVISVSRRVATPLNHSPGFSADSSPPARFNYPRFLYHTSERARNHRDNIRNLVTLASAGVTDAATSRPFTEKGLSNFFFCFSPTVHPALRPSQPWRNSPVVVLPFTITGGTMRTNKEIGGVEAEITEDGGKSVQGPD